jgi:hypothetical protein
VAPAAVDAFLGPEVVLELVAVECVLADALAELLLAAAWLPVVTLAGLLLVGLLTDVLRETPPPAPELPAAALVAGCSGMELVAMLGAVLVPAPLDSVVVPPLAAG